MYELQLEAGDTVRSLYLSPELAAWIDDYLVYQPKDRHKHLEPVEQVFEILDRYVKGRAMERSEMKKMEPIGEHVWAFKPQDVRIFGYFYRPKVFIAVCGEMKKNLVPTKGKTTNQLYKPFRQKVLNFRDGIDLDQPKYMKEGLHGLV